MQFLRKLEPFSNVVNTGTAVLNTKLVLGNVVERIILELGGTFTKAMITALRVRLNGKVVFGPVSGTDLDLIQRYCLLVNDANRLTIDFTEPVARSIQGQLMGAVDTNAGGVTDFTVEVDIAGATSPTLVGYVVLRSPLSLAPERGFDPATRPLIRALIPTTVTFSAAGEIQADINYGSRGDSLIKRVFIASTVVTGLRVKRDSLDVFGGDVLAAGIVNFVAQEYGRQNQSNFLVWDPLVDGNQSDAYPTRRGKAEAFVESNYQWLFTASGAGTARVLADVYTTLPRL